MDMSMRVPTPRFRVRLNSALFTAHARYSPGTMSPIYGPTKGGYYRFRFHSNKKEQECKRYSPGIASLVYGHTGRSYEHSISDVRSYKEVVTQYSPGTMSPIYVPTSSQQNTNSVRISLKRGKVFYIQPRYNGLRCAFLRA